MANHESLMDPWIIGSIMPIKSPVNWFTIEMLYDFIGVKQYLPKRFNKGLIGFMLAHIVIFTMKHTYTIKVAVQSCENMSKKEQLQAELINSAALKKANRVLSKKDGIVGIFSQRGRHCSVDNTSSSCLLLARKNNVPILPIHLSNGTVTIMKPIHVGALKDASSGKQARRKMAVSLMNTILDQVN